MHFAECSWARSISLTCSLLYQSWSWSAALSFLLMGKLNVFLLGSHSHLHTFIDHLLHIRSSAREWHFPFHSKSVSLGEEADKWNNIDIIVLGRVGDATQNGHPFLLLSEQCPLIYRGEQEVELSTCLLRASPSIGGLPPGTLSHSYTWATVQVFKSPSSSHLQSLLRSLKS